MRRRLLIRPGHRRRRDDGHLLHGQSSGGQAPSPVALVSPRGQARAPVLHRILRRSSCGWPVSAVVRANRAAAWLHALRGHPTARGRWC